MGKRDARRKRERKAIRKQKMEEMRQLILKNRQLAGK